MSKLLDFYNSIELKKIEYLSLGDIYDFQYGTGNTIPTIGGDYPVYGSNGIVGTHNEWNSEDAPIVGHIGAYAGIINWGVGKHYVTYNGVICKLKRDDINPRYGYHLLLMQNFGSKAKNGSQPFISYEILKEPIVPIPPKYIQDMIVEILDTFLELKEKLNSELDIRKTQFNYFEKRILSKDNYSSYNEYLLSDICEKIIAGGDAPKDTNKELLMPEGEYCFPVYSNGIGERALYGYSKSFTIPYKSVTISARGTVGYHEVREKYFTPIVRLITIIPNNDIVLPEFLNYLLDLIDISSTDGTIKQITIPMIKKLRFVLPPINEQKEIIEKLDIFTNLLNNKLPREIELRNQQYEYYRNKLLSFEEMSFNE